MARESYVATVLDWRQFLDLLDEEMAKSTEMKLQVALLEEMYARAQELVSQRNALRASMQTLTRELQEVLRTGRGAVAYLRSAVRVKVPAGSPQRKKLGVRTGGRPRKKRKAPAPRE